PAGAPARAGAGALARRADLAARRSPRSLRRVAAAAPQFAAPLAARDGVLRSAAGGRRGGARVRGGPRRGGRRAARRAQPARARAAAPALPRAGAVRARDAAVGPQAVDA